MSDKVTEALVEALRQAAAEAGEQRLFRAGKLSGLFASRAGVSGGAADRALKDGLLEVVRTENRGKATAEWVRITPRGIGFLHEHESPLQALEALQGTLRASRDGLPGWLAEMRQELTDLSARLSESARAWTERLQAMSERLDDAIRRAETAKLNGGNGSAHGVPWALEALSYLDRRADQGRPGECPLPELYAAVRDRHTDLTVGGFHDGLRRLSNRGVVRLLPHNGPAAALAEPEHALLDGPVILYYAARGGA